MEGNKLYFSQINNSTKYSEAENKFGISKELKKYEEKENKLFENSEKKFISVTFKGKNLKIVKKPRDKNNVKIALKSQKLKFAINSEKKENINELNNKNNMTERKKIVNQYKNLLTKLHFSPSQRFYKTLNNKRNNEKNNINKEDKISKRNKSEKFSFSQSSFNDNNTKKKNDISKEEINLKRINLEKYLKKENEENKKNKNEENKEIIQEKNKNISYRNYRSLSKERDKFKELRLKNKLYEEEKNCHPLVNMSNKLNKLIADFNKEKERKRKFRDKINSNSLMDFNLKGRNLLNRIRNLRKISQQ